MAGLQRQLASLPRESRWVFEKGRQWLREEEVARAFLLVRAQRLLLAEDVVADSPAEVAREVAGKGHVGLALQLAAQSGIAPWEVAQWLAQRWLAGNRGESLETAIRLTLAGDASALATCRFTETLLRENPERALPSCVSGVCEELMDRGANVFIPMMEMLMSFGRVEDCCQMVREGGG